MANLNLIRRLGKLEGLAAKLSPEQENCPCCRGMPRIAFPDEPENFGARYPFNGPGGFCRLCRRPPTGIKLFPLSPEQLRAFAAIPWSADASIRWSQKLSLVLAVWLKTAEPDAKTRMESSPAFRNLGSVDDQLARIFDRAEGACQA